MVHSWKETGEIPKGRPGLTLKKKIEASKVNREELWQYGLHEVPLAYNVFSREARALILPVPTAEKDAWKSSYGDEWITGTADYVGLLLELPWVDDLKTGRRGEYEPYKYQQAFYSLAWSLYQMGKVTQVRSTITHWPKYPIANPPSRFGVSLEPEFLQDLQLKLLELHRTMSKLKSGKETGMNIRGQLNPGEQCTYCPSRTNCEVSKYERE